MQQFLEFVRRQTKRGGKQRQVALMSVPDHLSDCAKRLSGFRPGERGYQMPRLQSVE